MKYSILTLLLVCTSLLTLSSACVKLTTKSRRTVVTIEGEKFCINGKPTYEGRSYQGHSIEGLLMNSRMVQGIFDDLNPASAGQWKYPDTQKWDAERNTNEFVQAMDDWHAKGLIAFTLNLQGGSPLGYGNKSWINSAIDSKGELRTEYMARLKKILDRADEKGMVVILGIYYFGQDQHVENESAVYRGVDNTLDWLFNHQYKNVIIEVANESNSQSYKHKILRPDRIHEMIEYIKSKEKNGYRYLVSTSFYGEVIPNEAVVKTSDYILLHGNGVDNPAHVATMVQKTKAVNGYKPMPIVFNEDDHYDFDKPSNNLVEAVKAHASWGYFDFRATKGNRGSEIEEGFDDGFQSIPVNWKISSPRKKAFFDKLEEITGGLK